MVINTIQDTVELKQLVSPDMLLMDPGITAPLPNLAFAEKLSAENTPATSL
jgi:hypothetical protein